MAIGMHDTSSSNAHTNMIAMRWPWLASRWQRFKGRARSSWHPHALYVFDAHGKTAGWDAITRDFGQWCSEHAGQVCSVSLSARWLMHSVAASDMSADAAHEHAMGQWAHYLDIDETAMDAGWVLRHTHAPGVNLLCAAPRDLVLGLQEQAAQHGVRIEAMHPWWAHGLQTWLASLASSLNDEDGGDVDKGTADSALASGPAQPPSSVAELTLHEPGLRIHVQAEIPPEGAPRLSHIWTEVVGDTMALGPVHPGPALLPPDPVSDEDEQSPLRLDHVWAHEAMADVLRGQHPNWRAAP